MSPPNTTECYYFISKAVEASQTTKRSCYCLGTDVCLASAFWGQKCATEVRGGPIVSWKNHYFLFRTVKMTSVKAISLFRCGLNEQHEIRMGWQH